MIFSEKVRPAHLLRKNHPWILQYPISYLRPSAFYFSYLLSAFIRVHLRFTFHLHPEMG
jgi:hypothetical protein